MKTTSVKRPAKTTLKPKPLPLHVPPGLHRRIKAVASDQGVSMVDYVTHEISPSVVRDEAAMRSRRPSPTY